MVIKDILQKVSNADPNDPKVKQLREKLAKLQGKPQEQSQEPEQKTTKPPTPEQSEKDEIQQLAQASEEERKEFAQHQNPRLKVKEERTHKLIANQVGELIELTTELQKRLDKAEQENKNTHQELEKVENKNEEMQKKMDLIDQRLEKFMGLYEIITNQYNPFAEKQEEHAPPPHHTPDSASQTTKKNTLRVADEVGGDEQSVEIQQGEMSSENKQKINQLLAELEAQEHEEPTEDTEQVPTESQDKAPIEHSSDEITHSLREELHQLFSGFENRMITYLDDSLQEKLHQTLSVLEQELTNEVDEAVEKKVDALTSHEDTISSALAELEALESESSDSESYASEEQKLVSEVKQVDEQIKAIPPSLYFRVQDGNVLKSKKDLLLALQDMDDAVFSHHVNRSHNDFADWLKLALKDEDGDLLREKSREQMVDLLQEAV